MPVPYSYDLRAKAVSAYHRGDKKIAICRLMKISRNTQTSGWKENEKQGTLKRSLSVRRERIEKSKI